jgi:hypothetical protein
VTADRQSWLQRVLIGVLGAAALAAVCQFAVRRMTAEYEAADAQAMLRSSGGVGQQTAEDAERQAASARDLAPDRSGSGTLVAKAIVGGALADGVLGASDRNRLQDAEHLLQADLAGRPEDGEAWLWLAYIETLRNDGRADDLVRTALGRSYASLPYPPLDLLLWRTRFAANLWPQLDPALRSQVLDRLSSAWSVGRSREDVEALQQQVTDPAGRTAIGLRLLALQVAEQGRRRASPPSSGGPPAA